MNHHGVPEEIFLETITDSRIGSREYIRQIEREAGKNASHRAKPSFAGGHLSSTCDFARAKNS